MEEWIDYYDSRATMYASKLHRDVHFEVIARDIIGYIASQDAVVLDYACGEALFGRQSGQCLQQADPGRARAWRSRPTGRPLRAQRKIRVRSLEELRNMTAQSIDLAVDEFGGSVHDRPRTPTMPLQSSSGCWRLAASWWSATSCGRCRHGDRCHGAAEARPRTRLSVRMRSSDLVRTALSDYRQLRARLACSATARRRCWPS